MKVQIDSLEADEHGQLYLIIQKFTDVCTKTTNGVFISSDDLPEECLKEIEKYLQFCSDQKKRIEEYTEQRKRYEKR
jgi:hypothetical protein